MALASSPVVNAAGDAAVIVVYPTTARTPQIAALVHRLRDQVIPQVTADSAVTAFVGGETAAGVHTELPARCACLDSPAASMDTR